MGAINHIRQLVRAVLDVAQDRQCVIDSLPIPVVPFHYDGFTANPAGPASAATTMLHRTQANRPPSIMLAEDRATTAPLSQLVTLSSLWVARSIPRTPLCGAILLLRGALIESSVSPPLHERLCAPLLVLACVS